MMDIEQIKHSTNILQIIGMDTQLKKVATTGGGEFAGPCPFCGGTDRFRVQPNKELSGAVREYCDEHSITSGVIIGIIGSLLNAKISYLMRLPGIYETEWYQGPLEIVSAQGSVALKGGGVIVHVHIQLSNRLECFGGHLTEAIVFSTAEVVIGELDFQLNRYTDDYTGLNELVS